MNDDNELRTQNLADEIDTYLKKNSLYGLARIIVKNIPKIFYNRLFWKLHCKNNN